MGMKGEREGRGHGHRQSARLAHLSLDCPRNLEIFPTVSKVARAQRETEGENGRCSWKDFLRQSLLTFGPIVVGENLDLSQIDPVWNQDDAWEMERN